MIKKKNNSKSILSLLLISVLIIPNSPHAKIGCVGRFVNPITDICWNCLFPITVAGIKITKGDPDPKSPKKLFCLCASKLKIPSPGIPIGFFEPVRLVDVTKSPFCMVGLGGMSFSTTHIKGFKDTKGSAFYHLHWYIYPVIYWLEILLDFTCGEMASVDVAYMTEFDPLWGDDIKTSILNPESFLFGSILALGSCVLDCTTSSLSLSNDLMFWCAGCGGGIYPFSGTSSYHHGAVATSQLIIAKFMAKMHRQLMLWGYMGAKGMCSKYPMPIIKKSQYRIQMTYPIPDFGKCKRIGQTTILWQAGREYPIKGEDFGYLIWRKRDCCLRAF